jgi:hypothetical protein
MSRSIINDLFRSPPLHMEDLINSFDDATAVRILGILARRSGGARETELTPEIRRTLQEEFGLAPAPDRPSKGDLSRRALIVLAQDPETREAITVLSKGPQPQSFEPVTTVVIVTAALIALQTHVRFERDAGGKLRVLIEKKPTKDTLLKPLVHKLISYLP